MEELKLLVESIANLPDLAIWVVAMYFFFKLAIVGSIFGIIRFFIAKCYGYFMENLSVRYKLQEAEKSRPIEHVHNLGSLSLTSSEDVTGLLVELFSLLRGEGYHCVHTIDLAKLIELVKKHKDNNDGRL